MLTIWGRNSSVNVQKVTWLSAELGLEVERRDVGGAFGGLETPEYRAMNPVGRIPTLQDGETVVFESNAILRYVASVSGAEAMWPARPADRARIDRWMEWAQQNWHLAVQDMFWAVIRTPRARQDAAQIAAKAQVLRDLAALLDGWMREGRTAFSAETPTLADFVLGTTLFRYYTMEFERGDHPALQAYYDRLRARPAYAAQVMIDYQGLRPPEDRPGA